jgi:hypothetical protein
MPLSADQLFTMGYSPDDVGAALVATRGDVPKALEWLQAHVDVEPAEVDLDQGEDSDTHESAFARPAKEEQPAWSPAEEEDTAENDEDEDGLSTRWEHCVDDEGAEYWWQPSSGMVMREPPEDVRSTRLASDTAEAEQLKSAALTEERNQWELIVRETAYLEGDESRTYWWNSVTHEVTNSVPTGLKRRDVAVIGEETCAVVETAAAFAAGNCDRDAACFVGRSGMTHVVFHPLSFYAAEEPEMPQAVRTSDAFVVLYSEREAFERGGNSVARTLVAAALKARAGVAPVLLLPSTVPPPQAAKAAARRFVAEQAADGRPVEGAEDLSSSSDAQAIASALGALLAQVDMLTAPPAGAGGRRCVVQ